MTKQEPREALESGAVIIVAEDDPLVELQSIENDLVTCLPQLLII